MLSNIHYPVYDIPYFHKGFYNHLVQEQDIDKINDFRNKIKDFVFNFIVKQGLDIVKERVQCAMARVKELEKLEVKLKSLQ